MRLLPLISISSTCHSHTHLIRIVDVRVGCLPFFFSLYLLHSILLYTNRSDGKPLLLLRKLIVSISYNATRPKTRGGVSNSQNHDKSGFDLMIFRNDFCTFAQIFLYSASLNWFLASSKYPINTAGV